MAKVRFSEGFRDIALGQKEAEAKGSSIYDVLKNLEHRFPGIMNRVCQDNGELRRFVLVARNGEVTRKLHTPIRDSDELDLLSAIAGG